MARRPTRRPTRAAAPRPSPARSPREAIIAALMDLLAEKRFEQIGLAEVAARAKVSLADLRNEFRSTLAIIAAHVKQIDRKVLAEGDRDMLEEPARERLFDVLMRRIEAMAPHRAAIRSLMRSIPCNAGLALALNAMAVNSQQWMLTAAGIGASGPKGMIRAQGMAVLFGRVVRVFVEDDEDNARTMAALDRALARGQRWAGFLDEVCALVPRFARRRRARRHGDDEAYAA